LKAIALRMSTNDKLALLLSLVAVLTTFFIARQTFENIPHLEDEIAYTWQAKLMAAGELTAETPIKPRRFLVPFVVDYEGRRFGKYPLGWPALLSIGIRLDMRDAVNPLLAGLSLWLMYLLVGRLLGETSGLIAAILTLSSPFFLLNNSSLLSHPLGLVFSAGFALAWLDAFGPDPPGIPKKTNRSHRFAPLTAGLTLGAFALTRPFTALGVALPFGIHGLYLLLSGNNAVRRRVLLVGLLAVLIGSLHFGWQYAATGDPFFNPYELWWEYDRVGFGPGFGVTESGHNLKLALNNLGVSLRAAQRELLGWSFMTWLLLPFGIWAVRKNRAALLVGSVLPSLILVYMAYWIGSWTFGPRYQYEGLYSFIMLSAAGISWLAGWSPRQEPGRIGRRQLAVLGAVGLLIAGSMLSYLPQRLDRMFGLYDISRSQMEPFVSAPELAPAVVIVHAAYWTDYGGLLDMVDPFLTTPFLFTFGDEPGLADTLRQHFPGRDIYHYYPNEMGRLIPETNGD
jgi:hypothetical protein